MACLHPRDVWLLNGKISWVKPGKDEGISAPLALPCGQCMACRLSKAQEWTLRITHEASLHPVTSFLTLTYAPDHLPPFGSLHYRDYQLFMKRLRKAIHPQKLRFFACGEYGGKTNRAHYHAVLFGYAPTDGVFYTEKASTIYTSRFLDSCWSKGAVYWSFFEPGAASYIARYVTKKITGAAAPAHYADPETGEVGVRQPEFARMSLKPGLGHGWYQRYYRSDVAHREHCLNDNNKPTKVPAYYDKLIAREFGEDHLKAIKKRRVARAKEKAAMETRPLEKLRDDREANLKARLGLYQKDTM